MAEPPQNGQAARRNPSTNKNIRKLRTASMVCSLTRSWQQWVVDNEDKQAKEPSGWAPSWMGEPPEETKKAWVPKTASKAAPDHNEATMDVRRMDVCQKKTADSGERKKSSTSPPKPKTEAEVEDMAGPQQQARIRTKQVVKTVTSVAKEKSAGVGLLAEKITKEALLPSADEIDRMLNKRSSPSRRRKCSNMVSSLTKSWKERQPGMIGGRAEEGHTPDVDRVDDGASEKKKSLDTEGGPNNNSRSLKKEEEEQEDLTDGHSVSAVKIKRPSALTSKKGAEDADKINALSKKYSAVGNLKSRWQNWASEHTVNQKLNPFSEEFDYEYSMSLRLHKGEEGYGRPKEGTKTAERARRAEQHIHREIDDMCYVIRTMADPDRDGKTRITFGELFDRYVRISDKVVGILMRARKHGKLAFDGEMLWQGQDDGVIITLLV